MDAKHLLIVKKSDIVLNGKITEHNHKLVTGLPLCYFVKNAFSGNELTLFNAMKMSNYKNTDIQQVITVFIWL